jgi:hypothetical protein
MELRKFITTTIRRYLNEQQNVNVELKNFEIKDNIYYHGTSNDVNDNFVIIDKIKDFDKNNTNWSKNIQGLGKFFTSNILNAYSYIDFRISDVGKIIEIYYETEKPYDVKNILKLMNILDEYGEKNNINSIIERNQMFIKYLIDNGYDSIILSEGPSYKPNSHKSKVIIPLIKQNIKIVNIFNAKTRNGGIFYS